MNLNSKFKFSGFRSVLMHLNAFFIRILLRIGRIFPRIPCKNNQFDSICENVTFSESPKCQWIESFTIFISFRLFHLERWNLFERGQYYWKKHLFTFYLCAVSVRYFVMLCFKSSFFFVPPKRQCANMHVRNAIKSKASNYWIGLNWWMHLSLEIKHFCLSK